MNHLTPLEHLQPGIRGAGGSAVCHSAAEGLSPVDWLHSSDPSWSAS